MAATRRRAPTTVVGTRPSLVDIEEFCEGRTLRERLPHHGGWTPAMRGEGFEPRSRQRRSLIQILPRCIRALWTRSCEGRDLNPRTSTGAELESAAVSGLGYPRTQSRPSPPSDLNHRFPRPRPPPDDPGRAAMSAQTRRWSEAAATSSASPRLLAFELGQTTEEPRSERSGEGSTQSTVSPPPNSAVAYGFPRCAPPGLVGRLRLLKSALPMKYVDAGSSGSSPGPAFM